MLAISLIAASSLISLVSAHGLVQAPWVRLAGPAMNATCGPAAVALVTEDPTSHVEGLPEAAAKDPVFNPTACNFFLCKGLQFADNEKHIYKYKPGDVVNFKVNLTIPHAGPANVSVVRTATNTIIGQPLISFPIYADEAAPQLPANNSDFNVTIPADLKEDCRIPGACVLQWWWFGTGATQTYEQCVDFIMSDGTTKANPNTASTKGAKAGSDKGATQASKSGARTRRAYQGELASRDLEYWT